MDYVDPCRPRASVSVETPFTESPLLIRWRSTQVQQHTRFKRINITKRYSYCLLDRYSSWANGHLFQKYLVATDFVLANLRSNYTRCRGATKRTPERSASNSSPASKVIAFPALRDLVHFKCRPLCETRLSGALSMSVETPEPMHLARIVRSDCLHKLLNLCS